MNVMERPHRYHNRTVMVALRTPEIHLHQHSSEVAADDSGVRIASRFPPQAGKNGADADPGAGRERDRPTCDRCRSEEQLVAGERTIEHATGLECLSLEVDG